MANTSEKHKQKKSQKRKDRQLRREEKKKQKAEHELSQQCSFMQQQMNTLKGTSKSLPGFLSKNINTICRWLNEYCVLFQKSEDAYIDYFKTMPREKRNQLVQDYVDIRVFISLIEELRSKKTSSSSQSICIINNNEVNENEEVVEQDMGEDCDSIREHKSVQVSNVSGV